MEMTIGSDPRSKDSLFTCGIFLLKFYLKRGGGKLVQFKRFLLPNFYDLVITS